MLKPFVKYTFLALIWKRYRGPIVSALLLLAFIFFVIIMHNDYVRYSETTGQQSQLALSFLIKWVLIVAAILAYIVYVKVLLRVKPKKSSSVSVNSTSKIESGKTDSFAAIRHKKKLRSKADHIIDGDS